MKKNYIAPEIEVVALDNTDVLTASEGTLYAPIIDMTGSDPLELGL